MGGFWEAKMVPKLRFLQFFWICLWRPYFWSNFVRFLIKSMAKNIGIFSEFSTRRFINCFLNLLISSMLETSKIVIFPRENAYFYKISFFAFDVKRYQTCTQSLWIGKAKGSPKKMKFGCWHASKIH